MGPEYQLNALAVSPLEEFFGPHFRVAGKCRSGRQI